MNAPSSIQRSTVSGEHPAIRAAALTLIVFDMPPPSAARSIHARLSIPLN
jgi:hypothetical protein